SHWATGNRAPSKHGIAAFRGASMPIPEGCVVTVGAMGRIRAVIVVYVPLGKVELGMRPVGPVRPLEMVIGIGVKIIEFVIVGNDVACRPPVEHGPHMAALKDVVLDERTRCLAPQIYVGIPRTGNMQECIGEIIVDYCV